jgi:hypothetical protein
MLPHVSYEDCEDVDELIRICKAQYVAGGCRLTGMTIAALSRGWWKLEDKKISCILDKKETPTKLDFSQFSSVSIEDKFDSDTSLELLSHGRTSTVEMFKNEILNAVDCDFKLPNPVEVWDLATSERKRLRTESLKARSAASPNALNQADVNSALGVTKSGITGALEARLKRMREA